MKAIKHLMGAVFVVAVATIAILTAIGCVTGTTVLVKPVVAALAVVFVMGTALTICFPKLTFVEIFEFFELGRRRQFKRPRV